MSEYLVVTGMSGAGRSTAAAMLEDLGWFVIDNLPAALITKVAELVGGSETTRVALVIGRGGAEEFEELGPALDALSEGRDRVRVLFLEASDEVLIRRFEGTRRRHPVAGRGVEEAIAEERRLLGPLRTRADVIVDSGELNTNQLRTRVAELFGEGAAHEHLQISLVSFGYKYGLPLDVDLVFDCRFLPNPYWVEELRPFSGLDSNVRDYVERSDEAGEFLERVDELLAFMIPAFDREGKSYLTVALGCTGGRHRSVAMAGALADRLTVRGLPTSTFHRDVDR